MRITIFAAGSRGDIQPCVVLGKHLQESGYRVRLAAPESFGSFLQQHGVPFAPLRGDVQRIMAGETGRAFMENHSANPLRSIPVMRKMIAPVIGEMAADLYQACLDADALICLGIFSAFGEAIAARLRIPLLLLEPTPLLPAKTFAAPSWPIQKNLGAPHNILSGLAMLGVAWLWYHPFVNEFRRSLDLPPVRFNHFLRALKSTPLLGAYSPAIIPPPPNWPGAVHVSGYLFLDEYTGWQPPPALQAFLDGGEPPVYVGFGSMAGRDPQRLAAIILDALALTSRRAVLLTGWGGLQLTTTPANVYVLDSAPHSWLLPRMAAVVHHGGAGTTAEGLRAGVPTVIVPFMLDQPFWGARVARMGLGPPPIAQKKLTAANLAQSIAAATNDPAIRQKARACGQTIRAEDGAANAVRLVQHYLGAP